MQVQEYVHFGIISCFINLLVVKLHNGRHVVVGIKRGIIKQINPELQFQSMLEKPILVIIMRVQRHGRQRQNVLLCTFLDINPLVEIDRSSLEYFLRPCREDNQRLAGLPRHDGRIKIDVAENIRKTGTNVRSQTLIDIPRPDINGLDGLEIILPLIVRADIMVQERIDDKSERIVWDLIPVAWDYDNPPDEFGYVCPGDDALINDPPLPGRLKLCHEYISSKYPEGMFADEFGGYSCDLHILEANSAGRPESPTFYGQLKNGERYTGYFRIALEQVAEIYKSIIKSGKRCE